MVAGNRMGLRAPTLRMLAVHVIAALLLAAMPPVLHGQNTPEERIRQQQQELNRIRQEREELQRRMRELQSSVRDLTAELRNLERQADATARLVRSLDQQVEALTGEVHQATLRLADAEAELVRKREVMRLRVRNIYKRGPLFTTEALLSARSFGDLLARYKYLHQLARYDRSIVAQVEQLRDQIAQERVLLVRLQDEVAANRAEKAQEEMRLRALESERQRALVAAQRSARQTEQRLAQIQRDEARLRNVIATLEAARRRAEARPNAPATAARSTISTSDIGRLDWPVEGDIIYRFGRVVNPNNTTTRWNGIGIAAEGGTPVRAISDGEVALVEPIGTYGLTVIVQHGGGDYSVYGSLQNASVQIGARVQKGQVIGAVGANDPDLPPHLHFEIRRERGTAVDPLEWLRGNRP